MRNLSRLKNQQFEHDFDVDQSALLAMSMQYLPPTSFPTHYCKYNNNDNDQ